MPAVPLRRNHSASPSPFFCHSSHRFGSLFLPKRCPKPGEGNSLSGSSRVHHRLGFWRQRMDALLRRKGFLRTTPPFEKVVTSDIHQTPTKGKRGGHEKNNGKSSLAYRRRKWKERKFISDLSPSSFCTPFQVHPKMGMGPRSPFWVEGRGQEATLGNYFPVLSLLLRFAQKGPPPLFWGKGEKGFFIVPLPSASAPPPSFLGRAKAMFGGGREAAPTSDF